MLKRLFTPLTLVNQLALIVLLATIIGVAGMAISARLVNGVQGSAHAINKAGSLRMQSYRLLAAIPLNENDQKLVADMTATVFSPELQNSARRDGQEIQLKALQQYWQLALAPGMQRAVNQAEVAQDVADFVDRIDQLVTAFDHTTEQRIERVVWIHRILAIGMALLLIFTIIWLRARLLRPWKQLLSMARAVSQRDFTQRAHISGRNEMATLGMALNNMSEELAESYAVLERRVQEKTAGLEQKNEILAFLWQANRRLHSSAPLCERISPVLNGLQGLTLLRDIEVRVYDLEDEDNHQEFTCHSDDDCDDKGCYLCPRNLPPLPDGGTTLKWRLSDAHSQYGILLATLPVGRHLSHDQQQLVDTLVEQLTSTLALDRHQEKQQQLIVMEERATIARELPRLHRPVAILYEDAGLAVCRCKATPCRRKAASCWGRSRNELNTSWAQLRELFNHLPPAVDPSRGCARRWSPVCQEYRRPLRLYGASLDYQLPPRFCALASRRSTCCRSLAKR
ncbi:nitrate/nitrite sensor protein [Klebsiella pneumoniae]|uniref:Nitrate/nitrite sensor protein n=1 Tax=Klebsiella pneumoniae TaxID=573 RepID=A0A377W4R7_KLEPN|nr:nitrate/nitrite sensor protein [Klebsiella pneumoniae]